MKLFSYLLFITVVFQLGSFSAAFAKAKLIYIDPKFDSTVPVYSLDKNGKPNKKPITSLIPGDMVSFKEIRKSDGMYIIRAKDMMGKEVDLALDPKTLESNGQPMAYFAPANARVIKIGGTEKSRGVNSAGLDQAVCSMADDGTLCRSYSPGDEINVDDAVLTLTTDGESPKPKWRNYYRSDDGWWVDSEDTNRVDETWSGIEDKDKENCEKKETAPMTKKDEKSLSELADSAQDFANDKQLETVMKYIGDCHPVSKTGDYHKTVVDGVAGKKLPQIFKQMKNEDGSVETVHANKADWVAMDVMARTLYGEMASCFAKGKQYPEAVAKVVLNRVDFNKDKPSLGSRFIDPGAKTDRRNDVTNAIFKDWQFSVWNRDDSARRMAMCPPSNPEKDFWNGNKPSEMEQKIWKEAVRISSEAVLSGQTFRKRTKDLTALYYTSNFELPQKHYKPITDAKIAGKAVPLSRCVQLWSAKDLKKWAPEHGNLFHPLFLRAFYQVVGF